MGTDPWLKVTVFFMVLAQVLTAFFMRDASWATIVILGYCWGGVINHSLTLAIHEISHNIAFGQLHPGKNRALGMFANLPLGIPYSTFFKKYHVEHHKYQGDDEMDVDIPSRIEARLFCTSGTKLLWLLLQPFFYALRPLFLRPKPVTLQEIVNFVVQMGFDMLIYHFFGWRSLVYLMLGTFLALGLHPVAGHFISEHYMFKKGYETYSYYGPLNCITFNVGYHNEHHDFPNIPGCNLPKVRTIDPYDTWSCLFVLSSSGSMISASKAFEHVFHLKSIVCLCSTFAIILIQLSFCFPQLKELAPEYYDNLPCHTSWVKVLWDFVTDKDIGPYSRIKRKRIPFPDEKVE